MKLTNLLKSMLGRTPAPALKPGQWRFSDLQRGFEERLAKWPRRAESAPNGAKVGVLVTPWMFTPVPFFSLECALMLAQRGADVSLIWDASNVFLNAAKGREIEAVRSVVARVEDRLRVVETAGFAPAADAQVEFVEPLVYENAVRQKRGEGLAQTFLETHPECMRDMTEHARRIHAMLKAEQFDWVLIPGGVWAVSGLYARIARDLGVSFSAFDSGVGSLYMTHDGPAAHSADIPQAFAAIAPKATASERARMIARAWKQLEIRREGRDPFQLQPASTAEGRDAAHFNIVVPLNYRSDTAALFRQKLFGSVTDWLTQLLDWAGSHPDAKVAIRQHPCERIPEYRGTDAWKEVLAPYAKLGARMRFVAAEDPINSYDLIDATSAVLPHTSRIGIEAAMLGKAVILGTHCYYEKCGFTQSPATAADYFDTLGRSLRGELVPDAEARDAAAIVYYLAELCLPLATNFTPQPPDYLQWVAQPPDEIWNSPAGQDLAEALLSRQPVSCMQHRRLNA